MAPALSLGRPHCLTSVRRSTAADSHQTPYSGRLNRASTEWGPEVNATDFTVERRAWDRLPISIPFFVRGLSPTGKEFLDFAVALNVSAGGVLLAARHQIDVGASISLEVPVAPLHKATHPAAVSLLRATVLRCMPTRQCFLLSLQFEEPLLSKSRSAPEVK